MKSYRRNGAVLKVVGYSSDSLIGQFHLIDILCYILTMVMCKQSKF